MFHFITAAFLVFASSHALAQDEGEKVPVKEGYETCLGQVKPGKSSDKEPGNSMNFNMDLGD